MSCLKGAATTALYGSHGINGAVVISTKSGKGFVDYRSASPDMNERIWNDKNSPAWGACPIVR